MEKKIKIPTKEQKRIAAQEAEIAELWFENIVVKSELESTQQEVADLWFQTITGGAF